ncbi:MAG: hypothetical protein HY784_08450 [Chloroflexi bacterium]|nr:hypothetical protein [Chloroflexota bacterium]
MKSSSAVALGLCLLLGSACSSPPVQERTPTAAAPLATAPLLATPTAPLLATPPPPPTDLPSASPPGPTLTAIPTPTPLPTLTPTPGATVIPPIESLPEGYFPPLTHDLYFLENHRLMRRNHATAQLETVLGAETSGTEPPPTGIGAYEFSRDGRLLAFIRYWIADPPGPYALNLLDMATQQITPVYEEHAPGAGLLGMALSPDGEWLAFIPQDAVAAGDRRGPGWAAPAQRPRAGGGPQSGVIYAVRTGGLHERVEVGYCAEVRSDEFVRGCGGMVWSPDSQSLAWSDALGLWLAAVGQGAPRPLLENKHDGWEHTRAYSAAAWSPAGRFLRLWISHYEGGSQAILDMQTGQLADLPDSFEYPEPLARAAWLPDGRLFALRSTNTGEGYALHGEVWRMEPGSADLLVLAASFPITATGREGFTFFAPEVLEDGRVALAVVNPSNADYQSRGLYVVAPDELTVRKLTGLPPGSRGMQVLWSPDGASALVRDWSTGRLLYVPADGSALYDLRPAMGENVCCFTWGGE